MLDRDERVFSALADRTRRQLLMKLAENSPKTITQLTEEFQITRQGITKHLDVLASAGLVQMQAQGREKHYQLAPEPLRTVSTWLEAIDAKWASRLLALKALVESDEDLS